MAQMTLGNFYKRDEIIDIKSEYNNLSQSDLIIIESRIYLFNSI